MRIRSFLAALFAALLAFFIAPPALAAPPAPDEAGNADAPYGRGPEDRGRSADAPGRQPDEPPPAAKLPGQPRDDVIEDVPVDPNDASIPLNLIPYHDIPPALRELQESERISVEVI